MNEQAEETKYRWVNAVLTIVVPLDDVTVDSTAEEKQEAVGRAWDRVADWLPLDAQEFVGTGHWEDAGTLGQQATSSGGVLREING